MTRSARTLLLAFALPVLASACQTTTSGPRWPREEDRYPYRARKGDVNVTIGSRSMDDNSWEPVQSQPAIGLSGLWEPDGSWIGGEAGLVYNWDSATTSPSSGPPGATVNTEMQSLELSLGLGKTFPFAERRFVPYIGAGLAMTWFEYAQRQVLGTIQSGSDFTPSGYAHLGFQIRVTRTGYVGIDYRRSYASDVQANGETISGDYGQFSLLFGASW
jgi:hypothetical protein